MHQINEVCIGKHYSLLTFGKLFFFLINVAKYKVNQMINAGNSLNNRNSAAIFINIFGTNLLYI